MFAMEIPHSKREKNDNDFKFYIFYLMVSVIGKDAVLGGFNMNLRVVSHKQKFL
jgi:hypothetical protein